MENFSKVLSVSFAFFFDSKKSRRLIPIIESLGKVDRSKFEKPDAGYCSLNDWFRRKIKKDLLIKSIPRNDKILFSPCEGMVRFYRKFSFSSSIKVKKLFHSLEEFVQIPLEKEKIYDVFDFQLRPRDCHVVYSNVDGKITHQSNIGGKYLPVNFFGRLFFNNLFCKNRRDISVIDTENLGKIYFIEVGALNVGSIRQIVKSGQTIRKGQEKSYFQFGGSAVVIIIEQGKIKTDLNNLGRYVFVGSPIGNL